MSCVAATQTQHSTHTQQTTQNGWTSSRLLAAQTEKKATVTPRHAPAPTRRRKVPWCDVRSVLCCAVLCLQRGHVTPVRYACSPKLLPPASIPHVVAHPVAGILFARDGDCGRYRQYWFVQLWQLLHYSFLPMLTSCRPSFSGMYTVEQTRGKSTV